MRALQPNQSTIYTQPNGPERCESGDDEVLQRINKGETYQSSLEALRKIHAAGLKSSVMVLLFVRVCVRARVRVCVYVCVRVCAFVREIGGGGRGRERRGDA